MRAGLDVLLSDHAAIKALAGRKVGLCCNHTAVTRELDHATAALRAAGVTLTRIFAPEHGVDALAQDMIGVEGDDAFVPTISLYGSTAASLRPDPGTLSDLDVVLFDIQDIGSRYYTYQATLGYLMEVAAETDTEVVVLDRPNPIDGVSLEGNVVEEGYESFVGAYPLANRHGMTMGELGTFFARELGIDCPFRIAKMEGWRRDQWFDETGLPWIFPSPNMPTLETAAIYPGLCLVEGTNLSEGRGTTRPFHLVGAPWIDRDRMTELCRTGAADAQLEGVGFRAASFEPRFQKHATMPCHGIEIVLTERRAVHSLLLGLVVLEAAIRTNPDRFAWRTETYEFVDDPIAFDLLTGSSEARAALETHVPPRELIESWKPALDAFAERRARCLLY
jgi:uncharacterized protein YbbC (DUF1343 family)